MKKRVADCIMETLVSCGVDTCFGVIGGGAMHLYNALALNDDIRKVSNHNEQASAMAAEAYARISGKCAAVCVTSGPGATNVITGAAGAWQDSIPMIVLTGQVRTALSIEDSGLPLRYRGPQEFPIIPAVKNFTKYAVRITDPLDACYEVEKAVYLAMHGRRGPVWLDIPLDIQGAQVEVDMLRHFNKEELGDDVIVDSSQVSSIVDMLRAAKRPCILIGSGIVSAHAQDGLEEFINEVGVPVVGGSHVAENFYHTHRLFYGLSGDLGPRVGNFILQNSDCILVLANSLGFRQTGYTQSGFAPNARIIMVDIDENEAKKPGLNIDMFLQADINQFFEAASACDCAVEVDHAWIDYCDALNERFDRYEGAEGNDAPEDRVSSYYFWKEYDKLAPKDNILCLGCNSGCSGKVQIGSDNKEQRIITNYTIGSLGSDLPYAIGSAIATGRRVVCATGDGGIMFNLQELQTIKHYDLPISIVLFSNGGYNALRQTAKNFFDGFLIGCTPETGISFPNPRDLALTFGFEYRVCENNGQVEEALREIFSSNRRILLEVKQRYDDPVTPKLQSRMNENGEFETPLLHDMAPFISDEEMKGLMLWGEY